MPSVSTGTRDSQSILDATLERFRGCLERHKDRICEEIRNYPKPIPACDLQFNALLEDRASVGRSLRRLADLSGQGLTVEGQIEIVESLLASSQSMSADMVREIRSSLDAARGVTD